MENGGEMIKKTKGRQKREIKRIENKKNCQIAFTKRKDGLLKKANEIKSLCDAGVDLIIYSSSGKAYYYGDSSLKTIKMALSNEQQPQNSNQLFGYIMEEMSRKDMHNLVKKNDSLVDRLNAEKERAETLSNILKTIKTDNSTTNWWDTIGQSCEKNKEFEKILVTLQQTLKNQISLKIVANQATITTAAESVISTFYHNDQTIIQVNPGVIGPYRAHGSMSTFSNITFATVVNPFDATRGFGNQNVPVWYPSYQHQQGYNDLFFYDASNRNGVGRSSGGDDTKNYLYHSNYNYNNNGGGFFGFPYHNNPFNNGYGCERFF
ncbi:MADS-box transcription factor 4-like [Arachis stenosperma]|uniref:MADS-box transcription factor 4-like n=1 Tax=Arachis stenosperma TaxID=217475 RepID=UPI0025AD278C|nr:MADS-box transcription factor 4-like [Arachis stenosperma]